ncbi:expressed sequence AA467197, isoform CRA_b [Mus musculus]|nr:expressed sequence AA467197, isoform CRA_b [Mus musculus]
MGVFQILMKNKEY